MVSTKESSAHLFIESSHVSIDNGTESKKALVAAQKTVINSHHQASVAEYSSRHGLAAQESLVSSCLIRVYELRTLVYLRPACRCTEWRHRRFSCSR